MNSAMIASRPRARAAAAWRNITHPGQDGLGVRLIVNDGERFERLDADVPRATSVETDRIEDADERRAALYTHDEQLDRLAASRLSFPELVLDVDEDRP